MGKNVKKIQCYRDCLAKFNLSFNKDVVELGEGPTVFLVPIV